MEDFDPHKENQLKTIIAKSSFLITGGAGFIGSNIVKYLIDNGAKKVRVLDNLSTGKIKNLSCMEGVQNFEFIEGDIRSFDTCVKAVKGIDYISHQAALGSVPRSINDPVSSNETNVSGFLNMITAAKDSKNLKRFIYASSSSVYGDSLTLPKKEGDEGKLLSPYALTKFINEEYATIFSKLYDFHSIGLRYFNVFGPNQNADSQYAAVIPIFCKNFITNKPSIINGSEEISRDFTYVENAIYANILALMASESLSCSSVYNVACGDRVTLGSVINTLKNISNKDLDPIIRDWRKGDIPHSNADIRAIYKDLGYRPKVTFEDGLRRVYNWYQNNLD